MSATFTKCDRYPGWTIGAFPDRVWRMSHPGTAATVEVRELVGGFGAWVVRVVNGRLSKVRVWGFGGAHVRKACEEAMW